MIVLSLLNIPKSPSKMEKIKIQFGINTKFERTNPDIKESVMKTKGALEKFILKLGQFIQV